MEILYICDRKACEVCKKNCKFTRDISHAKNFGKANGKVWETDDKAKLEFQRMKELMKPIYQEYQKAIKSSSELRKKINMAIAENVPEGEILDLCLELIESLTGDTTMRCLRAKCNERKES